MATQNKFIAKNGLDNNNQIITNVLDPVGAQDAATKAYVDAHSSTATKESVGLGNVDNTSDANKPVSTAQATAIGVETSRATAAEALLAPQTTTYTKTQVDSAIAGATPSFSTLTGKPTTLSGFGITDAMTATDIGTAIAGATPSFSTLTGKPTTLSGFGITDAMTATDIGTAIGVAIPTQTGNSGKYLTTNGTSASWGAIPKIISILNRTGTSVLINLVSNSIPVLNRSSTTIQVGIS